MSDPQPTPSEAAAPPLVGYVVSRFPKLTESFILYEMERLERLGFRGAVFPLVNWGRTHGAIFVVDAQAVVL